MRPARSTRQQRPTTRDAFRLNPEVLPANFSLNSSMVHPIQAAPRESELDPLLPPSQQRQVETRQMDSLAGLITYVGATIRLNLIKADSLLCR